MADALPDMPQFRADTQLAEKIRHGKMISTRDLTGTNGRRNPYRRFRNKNS